MNTFKLTGLAMIGLMSTMTQASSKKNQDPFLEKPMVITAIIAKNFERIDMQQSDYAILRFGKKNDGTLINAKVETEDLAYCNILKIIQNSDSIQADIIVSFEFENDGGYNSCHIKVQNDKKTYDIELGTEAGE